MARLDDEKVRELDRVRSDLAAQSIDDCRAREAGQIAEIEAGLADADQEDFASAEDLGRVITKYVLAGHRA